MSENSFNNSYSPPASGMWTGTILFVLFFGVATWTGLGAAQAGEPEKHYVPGGSGMHGAHEMHDAPGAHGMKGAHDGMMKSGMPADLDMAMTKMSEHHRFNVSVESQKTPPPINAMHTWVLTVRTPDGHAVEGARITVNGGMPMHGHGLPSAPRVTKYQGDGRYLVEGVKFNMSGWWKMDFNIVAGDNDDQVAFNIVLQ